MNNLKNILNQLAVRISLRNKVPIEVANTMVLYMKTDELKAALTDHYLLQDFLETIRLDVKELFNILSKDDQKTLQKRYLAAAGFSFGHPRQANLNRTNYHKSCN